MVEILNFNLPVRKESMMKKIKIIAIVGKSGAGKDFWLHRVCEDDDEVHEIISCTTRPARWTEVDGRNYHFLSENQFMSEQFLESCMFKGWRYGTRYKDIVEDKVNIGVFNLTGVEQLLKNPKVDLTMIYLYAENKVRLIRQLQRDSSDIEEIFRRYQADEKDFTKLRIDEIKEHIPVHIVLNNTDNQSDDNEFIIQDFDEIINEVKSK